jgi:outer membrane biosynthesis protein TonB
MPAAFPIRWQFERRLDTANTRLAVALAVSIVLHVLGYATWKVAPIATAAMKSVVQRVLPKIFSELQPQPKVAPPAKREVPLVFVEVDPALASAEPPKETKNYSTHNSVAANEQPKKADVPKIDGKQTHVLRTTDNPKPEPKPLQPAPPPEPKPAEQPEPEAKPRPTPQIGDLALARPEPKPLKPSDGTANKAVEKPLDKPRTVREAMARNPGLAGQKIQQDGGVERRAHISLDAKGSPFGNYDAVFIGIVQQRWYSLLEDHRFVLERRGKVSLTFQLHYDGRVTQMETQEDTVGEILSLLCQKAILDPAPFPKWPADMRKLVGTDIREVRFTFYYD